MREKPRVSGVEFQGRWHYVATCPCGWSYGRWDADWAFIVTIAVAHTWLKRGAW